MPELGTEVTFLFAFLAFLGIIWKLHFQHAFHCISRDLLITKFLANVLDFQSLNFIFSYLTERKQSKKTQLYGPFLSMGFNSLMATEPLQKDSLLFTTQFPGFPGTHLINLGRMKDWVNLGATKWYWTWDPWIGNPVP